MSEAPSGPVRRVPLQGRSTQRFELILDTTAALIDEVGYAAISVSVIAKRSGMTGPAVYRYFDDLHAIAGALAHRNRTRFITYVNETLAPPEIEWDDALRIIVNSYADMFRTEPGFRWLRLGDELDRNLITRRPSGRAIVAGMAADLFFYRYDVDYRPDLVAHVEVMTEFADALVTRAFLFDLEGDQFFIDECAVLLISYLANYLAQPYDKSLTRPPAPDRRLEAP